TCIWVGLLQRQRCALRSPSFGRSMCVPVGRPMSHESAGERIFQERGSLNLLSGPQNRVSLPSKVLTSAGLSRLSVALEIECPELLTCSPRGLIRGRLRVGAFTMI